MKIKNELLSIKIGNKHYDFNNLILDAYLERFIKSQMDENNIKKLDCSKQLNYCLLKFDTPIENLTGSSILYNQNFDCVILNTPQIIQEINEKQISINYSYFAQNTLDYSDNQYKNIADYKGKKIMAIGFNVWYEKTESALPVLAVLDTSNYNIYIQDSQELSITRMDTIITDALFYTNDKNKVPGPAHLSPSGLPEIISQPEELLLDSFKKFKESSFGILYSIGLSSCTDCIDKEFVIGTDIQVEQNGTELNINGLENYLSTDSTLLKSNYKYVILKYKVWQIVHSGDYNNVISTTTDTGYYYYQVIPTDKFGKINLKIKYERG